PERRMNHEDSTDPRSCHAARGCRPALLADGYWPPDYGLRPRETQSRHSPGWKYAECIAAPGFPLPWKRWSNLSRFRSPAISTAGAGTERRAQRRADPD